MKDIETAEVGAEFIAKLFGISRSMVSRLNSQGVIWICGKDKYELGPTIQRYVQHLKRRGQVTEKGTPKAAQEFEKALLTAAQREKSELELELFKRNLHKSEHVALLVTQMISAAKQKFAALPTKVAPKIAGLKSTADIKAIVEKEINDALMELSEFDTTKYLDDLVTYEEVDAADYDDSED